MFGPRQQNRHLSRDGGCLSQLHYFGDRLGDGLHDRRGTEELGQHTTQRWTLTEQQLNLPPLPSDRALPTGTRINGGAKFQFHQMFDDRDDSALQLALITFRQTFKLLDQVVPINRVQGCTQVSLTGTGIAQRA